MAMSQLQQVLNVVLLLTLPMFGLMVLRGPQDGNGDETPGFWGAKTASVNWCERDYVISFYVAEFANSLTSLCIVMSGIYGIYAHAKAVEFRYIAAFISFIVVGLGSFAFHATLTRSMQLLDELPMVWINSIFIYICRTIEDEPGHVRLSEMIVLICLTLVATLAIIRLDTENQNVFLLCYGTGVIYLVQSSYQFCKRSTGNAQLLFWVAMVSYASGFLLWLVDRNHCASIWWLYLHTFWHFGADLGTFTAMLLWIWIRFEHLGQKAVLRGETVFTWWVALERND
eukprot:symbB.v1.2.027816.t1/scaffold2876.1/size118008/4